MQVSERNHFVWKFYLKPWSKNGRVYCSYNKKPIKNFPILDDVGVANKFYKVQKLNSAEILFLNILISNNRDLSIQEFLRGLLNRYILCSCYDDDSKIQAGEDFQGIIETEGLPFLLNLYNENLDFLKTDKGRFNFILFLCMQYFRTKFIRDRYLKMQKITGVRNENIANIEAIIMAFNITCDITASVQQYRLVLLKNNTNQEFITADQPIVNTFVNYKLNEKVNDLEFYYPISPKRAILLTKQDIDTKIDIAIEKVDYYNNLIINASEIQIYCHNPHSLDRYLGFASR